MVNTREVGNRGEDWAAEWLQGQGYEIWFRNYRHGRAEIDIIARKGKLVVFVEVKTRSNLSFGDPEIAVNRVKISHIKKAAEHFIHANDWPHDVRFDVIAISLGEDREIRHIEDAFY